MSRYVVRFMKDVLGENGRECEVCQGTLEIDAPTESQATELAAIPVTQLRSVQPDLTGGRRQTAH